MRFLRIAKVWAGDDDGPIVGFGPRLDVRHGVRRHDFVQTTDLIGSIHDTAHL